MELKFRAWHKERKEYYKVTRLDFRGYLVEFYNHLDYVYERIDTNEVIIEQYTDSKDKNGKEIYVGDILYFEPYKTHSNDRVVEHIDGAYRGRLIRSGYSKLLAECVYETKIIGNIHENKELLD